MVDYFIFNRRKGSPGCHTCNKGFLSVEVKFDNKKICMKNPNLFLEEGQETDENSIDNCILYDNST